ncbi:MAG TPA: alpha/beta fold hydrolase [Alphaproteobacteria bacterium]|nr:alpha/beta fold hydrolase [Alphaproteobacteria bacterium]
MARRPAQKKSPKPSRAAHRLGPRPLALHLASAGTAWASLRAALPLIASGGFPWPAPLAAEAAALQKALGAVSGDDLAAAVDHAGEDRFLEFAAGVSAYRAHPYRRSLKEPPVLWREGTTRLLDYGTRNTGSTVLVVPSLVNRGHVLDLTGKTSLLRYLAARGHRPLLVDWDAPGEIERGFDLTDYIAGRLAGALDAAAKAAGKPLAVIGYCMGGNLALALAQLHPNKVSALALLATPWDFQAEGAPIQAPLDAANAATLTAAFASLAEFPVDLLQAMFASLDPYLVGRKYRAFAKSQQAGENGELFVALEDWVNDGVPLAAKVAAECLVGWYGQNAPMNGAWRVAGETIDPARCDKPALLLMPQQDKIVPLASSAALAAALPKATAVKVPSGHVAMIVGRQARAQSWEPLADWLDGMTPKTKTAKAPAKKTPAKKTPAKKAPARKTPATKRR